MSARELAAFRSAVQDIATEAGGLWRIDLQLVDEGPTLALLQDRSLRELLRVTVGRMLDGGRLCLTCDQGFGAACMPLALGVIRPLRDDVPTGIAFGLCDGCCAAGGATIDTIIAKLRGALFSDLRIIPPHAIHTTGGRA